MSEKVKTHQIHKANLPALKKRIERLSRKAEKYGLPIPSYEVISESTRPRYTDDGLKTGRVVPVLYVRIIGQSPVLEGGWRLAGVVDHRVVPHDDLGWPLYSIDDELEIPDEYHHEPPWCDHCDLYRDRLETFIIVNEDGEWKRVGRQCLKDYVGGVPLHAYAAYLYDIAQLAHGLDDEDLRGGGKDWLDTEIYLSHVVAVIDKVGWRSRGTASESFQGPPATADQALDNVNESDRHAIRVTDAHRDEARAALDWARDELAVSDDLNEYEYNLVIAASQQATETRRVGLVASLPQAHQRFLLDQRLADESNSAHQGEVGERLELKLTVTKRLDIEIDAYHGRGGAVLKVHVMQDENGNVYVWKTTSKKLAEHETYRLRGTVKSHDDYKGIPQTTLTRCAKIVHDPCGELEYLFDDAGWHCLTCDQDAIASLEVENG